MCNYTNTLHTYTTKYWNKKKTTHTEKWMTYCINKEGTTEMNHERNTNWKTTKLTKNNCEITKTHNDGNAEGHNNERRKYRNNEIMQLSIKHIVSLFN